MRDAARRDLVVAYAGAGNPEKALAFFGSTDAANVPSLLLLLGEEYVRLGLAREAVALYYFAVFTSQPRPRRSRSCQRRRR